MRRGPLEYIRHGAGILPRSGLRQGQITGAKDAGMAAGAWSAGRDSRGPDCGAPHSQEPGRKETAQFAARTGGDLDCYPVLGRAVGV